MSKNPFQYLMCGHLVEATDASSRIDMVKRFSALQCTRAAKVEGLQKTVHAAILRRLRTLERGES